MFTDYSPIWTELNLHGVLEQFPILQEILCDFISVWISHVSVFVRLPLRKLQAKLIIIRPNESSCFSSNSVAV